MLFVFYTTCTGEEFCYSISSENIDRVIWPQPLPFHSRFRSDTIFQFFLSTKKIQRLCVCFYFIVIVHITEFGEEVVVLLRHSQFCVLKTEKLDNDWHSVFSLCLGEFNFVQWFALMIWLPEQFTIQSCLFFCHWGTSLQCVGSGPWFGNRRSCWLETSLFLQRHFSLYILNLPSCFCSWLHKASEAFLSRVLNKTMYFCANKTQL